MTHIVCPTKKTQDSGVFCWAFDTDLIRAKEFARAMTQYSWDTWRDVGSPSGFSGCEGLKLYVHASTNADRTTFDPLCVFVQGKEYGPDAFDK